MIKKNRKNLRLTFKLVCALVLFVLFSTSIQKSYARSNYSNIQITLTSTNLTLKQLINEVENQTNYLFIYKSEDVNENSQLKVEPLKNNINSILNQALSSLNISYKIKGNSIILNKIEKPSSQQNKQSLVRGVILDNVGNPIIGASIIIEGTMNGVSSDVDGKFEINAKMGSKLSVSSIGYKTKLVTVTSSILKITLENDAQLLQDVVVVGYGTQKKVNMSGAVSQVNSKELTNRPITNVSTGLQGLMSGVNVTTQEGRPGADNATIRIRGVGTLNNSSPYILIDGVETDNMNSLDPNEIQSISVLKDASSAAIYGSKASNGVILITTKRGVEGKPRVSYSGYVGIENPTQTMDRLSSYDYARLYDGARKDYGLSPVFSDEELQLFKDGTDPDYPDTDWWDLCTETGFQTHHNIIVSGGTENAKYMASVGYLNQHGILPNSTREQFNSRTNLDLQINPRLHIKLNQSYINNAWSDPNTAYAPGSSRALWRILTMISPWVRSKYDDGTYGTISDGNPLAWLDSDMTLDYQNENFSGLLSADYKILDNLKATVNYAYVSNNMSKKAFMKDIQYNSSLYDGPNQLDEDFTRWQRKNLDILLNYDKTFGKHDFKLLGGFHSESYNYRYNTQERSSFPNNNLTDMNAGQESTMTNAGFTRELNMLSYFGRLNYEYNNKYLFEANCRADASSRFSKDERWGYFPSFSAAWRLTQEDFMKSMTWLNNLKIRMSWGLLGNQDALDDYYPALTTYATGANYTFGDSYTTGYYQAEFNMSSISWEKSRTMGIGIDFGFLDKFEGSLDLYDRKTTDIIMEVPVPTAFALNSYYDNVGAMSNKGIEMSLTYRKNWGEFNFSATGTVSYNKNKILNLGGVESMTVANDGTDAGNQIEKIGSSINSFYGYKADGLFQSDAEAEAYMNKYKDQNGYPFSNDFKAGDIKFKDTNNDGAITSDDRIVIGSEDPSYIYGLNLNFGYKRWNLSTIFTAATDVYRYFSTNVYGGFSSGDSSHPASIWNDSWSSTNTNTNIPRAAYKSNNDTFSSFWVQNASYVRLKSAQLTYNIPEKYMEKFNISAARIYLSGENLFTIDDIMGNIDPETPSGRGIYPILRTITLGVNLTF